MDDTLPTFPLVAGLADRGRLAATAENLLRRAGLDELAEQASAAVENLTPLDKEVIALFFLALDHGLISGVGYGDIGAE